MMATFPPLSESVRQGLETLNNHFIPDYERLKVLGDGLRVTNLRIGATIGSFDLLHTGHARYLMAAKAACDILFVGVDSDAVIRASNKGEDRPIVPQVERIEMLLHTGYPDYVTLIDDMDAHLHWTYGLLEVVRPQVFVTSIGSYSAKQLEDIRALVPEVLELERQAETSTSEKVRQIVMSKDRSIIGQLEQMITDIKSGAKGW